MTSLPILISISPVLYRFEGQLSQDRDNRKLCPVPHRKGPERKRRHGQETRGEKKFPLEFLRLCSAILQEAFSEKEDFEMAQAVAASEQSPGLVGADHKGDYTCTLFPPPLPFIISCPLPLSSTNTVEPPNKGHFGANSLSLVERLSLSRR